eukprot:scaffold76595_cov60-Phaeocystis_antarctica.AAC.3
MHIWRCLSFSGRCSRIPACAEPNCACTPGQAHKTKHAMTKHLALFASLGRLTLSLHISVAAGDGAMPAPHVAAQ